MHIDFRGTISVLMAQCVHPCSHTRLMVSDLLTICCQNLPHERASEVVRSMALALERAESSDVRFSFLVGSLSSILSSLSDGQKKEVGWGRAVTVRRLFSVELNFARGFLFLLTVCGRVSRRETRLLGLCRPEVSSLPRDMAGKVSRPLIHIDMRYAPAVLSRAESGLPFCGVHWPSVFGKHQPCRWARRLG